MANLKKQWSAIELNFSEYLTAVDAVRASHVIKAKRMLQGNSLSYSEKRLIMARLALHDKNWNEVISILNTFKSDDHPFILGEVNSIFAFTLARKNEYSRVLEYLNKAERYYREIGHGRGVFTILFNKGVHFEKEGQLSKAMSAYRAAEDFVFNKEEEAHIHQAQAFIACFQGNFPLAKEEINKTIEVYPELNAKDQAVMDSGLYQIYFACGEVEKTEKILLKALKNRTSHLYPRIFTDKLIFDFVTKGSIPRRVPRVVKENEVGIFWGIVEAIALGYEAKAKELWSHLHQKSPRGYGEFMQVLSPEEKISVFGQAMANFLNHQDEVMELDRKQLPTKKLDRLIFILENASSSVSKEDLYQLIWEEEYDPSKEAKLYKLIQRARKLREVPIESHRFGYFIKS